MLKEIYQMRAEQEGCTKESRALGRKIADLSRDIDCERAKKEDDYVYSLLNLASAYGEENGFLLGFKYAVRIITYCFG